MTGSGASHQSSQGASGGGTPAAAVGEISIREAMVGLLPDLRAYARFLMRDTSRADDLVQETVLRALAASAQFQPGTSPKAWLFTIQRNTFLMRTRAARREDVAMRAHANGAAPEPQPHGAEIADLQAMLWTLPPSQREALLLVGAQELSHEEAAVICGVPPGTMRARVSRARAQLARAYANEDACAREDADARADKAGTQGKGTARDETPSGGT